MSVKLEWDIDNEQGKHNLFKEDKNARKARYRPLFTLLFSILVLASIVAGLVYAINWRWNQVNERIEALLVDTVQAEVASLRIGDFDAFINMQRSASDDWYRSQQQTFQFYQELKATNDVSLVGEVLNVEIDGQRGRVQVQEIVDGIPYVQTWFYWRFEAGWAHVPPDYTFWGDKQTITSEYFTIMYRDVDQLTAQDMQANLERWFDDACGIVDCLNLSPLSIEIVVDDLVNVSWASDANDNMLVSTPYRDRARQDMPFDRQYQVDAATLIANYLIDYAITNGAVYPADVHFLQTSLVAWFVGRFVQINPETPLIDSIVANYGVQAVSQLINSIQPSATISILSGIDGVSSLADATLDWRDFVVWRLSVENDLILSGDEASWLTLYDFSNANLRSIAYGRYTASQPVDRVQVLELQRTTTNTGQAQLIAIVQYTTGTTITQETVTFNLVDNNWLRAS